MSRLEIRVVQAEQTWMVRIDGPLNTVFIPMQTKGQAYELKNLAETNPTLASKLYDAR